MSNNLRTRNGLPFNFVDGIWIKGIDIQDMLSSSQNGLQLASDEEALAGTVTDKAVSPAGLKGVTSTIESNFEEKLTSGTYGLQLASDEEALAGTVTDKAVSPAAVKLVANQIISDIAAQIKKTSGPSNYFNYQM